MHPHYPFQDLECTSTNCDCSSKESFTFRSSHPAYETFLFSTNVRRRTMIFLQQQAIYFAELFPCCKWLHESTVGKKALNIGKRKLFSSLRFFCFPQAYINIQVLSLSSTVFAKFCHPYTGTSAPHA